MNHDKEVLLELSFSTIYYLRIYSRWKCQLSAVR